MRRSGGDGPPLCAGVPAGSTDMPAVREEFEDVECCALNLR